MFSQVDNPMLSKMQKCLSDMGVHYTKNIAKRKNPKHQNCHRLYISRKPEVMHVLGQTQPVRLMPKFDIGECGALHGMNKTAVGVASKRFIGEQRVISMATSTKTFIAEGFASHNCDPDINLMVQIDQTRFCAYENCDAVEADADGYQINGIQVSNFVLPSYFSPRHPGPWDFQKMLGAGMPKLRPDGYLSIYVLGQGWTQTNAATSAKMRMKAIPHIGSRRQRRTLPRDQWEKSTK